MNDPIEVEVLEIDGHTPPPAPSPEPQAAPPPWQAWQGRIKTLDARWWPLWLVLGVLLLALALTVGVVFGALFLVVRTVSRWIGGLLNLLGGGPSTTSLRR